MGDSADETRDSHYLIMLVSIRQLVTKVGEMTVSQTTHFVVLGASLLFDHTYFGASFTPDVAFLGFSPFLPMFTYFHSPHVLLSRLISPHYGSPQCGHSASASIDLHSVSDAIVKVKINMQMTSAQMKISIRQRAAR